MKRARTMRVRHLAIPAIAVVGTIAAAIAPPAVAASADVGESTSANWSGYVANGSPSGEPAQFSNVAGSWVEPRADCSSGDGDAAFWVGLGGASDGPAALEQVGTQVDCSAGGAGEHYAWYELVPAAPIRLDVAIRPGDRVSARVAVTGTAVTVSLSDQSTGASATKTLEMNNPDTSSAEWIAEVPSVCQGSDASITGNCTPVSLANFGSVTFTGASATASGSAGAISSANWTAQAVQLNGSSGAGSGYPGIAYLGASGAGSASATPSPLSTDGSSFSVAWQADGSQAASSSSYPDDPGSGYEPAGDDGYGAAGSDPYGDYGTGAGAYSDGGIGY
jgi:hypothetical protein